MWPPPWRGATWSAPAEPSLVRERFYSETAINLTDYTSELGVHVLSGLIDRLLFRHGCAPSAFQAGTERPVSRRCSVPRCPRPGGPPRGCPRRCPGTGWAAGTPCPPGGQHQRVQLIQPLAAAYWL